MRKKSKKPVGGVYASQDWSQKTSMFSIKGTFCVNTPKKRVFPHFCPPIFIERIQN